MAGGEQIQAPSSQRPAKLPERATDMETTSLVPPPAAGEAAVALDRLEIVGADPMARFWLGPPHALGRQRSTCSWSFPHSRQLHPESELGCYSTSFPVPFNPVVIGQFGYGEEMPSDHAFVSSLIRSYWLVQGSEWTPSFSRDISVDPERLQRVQSCWENGNIPRIGKVVQSADRVAAFEDECVFASIPTGRNDIATKLLLSLSYVTNIPVNRLSLESPAPDAPSVSSVSK